MPAVQDLLSDVDTRYRNTFTPAQKVTWMNLVQRQIYQAVRHDAAPTKLWTIANQALYTLPSEVVVKNIEQVVLQDQNSNYIPLQFRKITDESTYQYYSTLNNQLFIYPTPTQSTLEIIIYHSKIPTDLDSNKLYSKPDLDEDWHELLILGTLSRVAGARKDAVMKNNYDSDYQLLLDDYMFMNKVSDPDFTTPVDELPRIRRAW